MDGVWKAPIVIIFINFTLVLAHMQYLKEIHRLLNKKLYPSGFVELRIYQKEHFYQNHANRNKSVHLYERTLWFIFWCDICNLWYSAVAHMIIFFHYTGSKLHLDEFTDNLLF